MFRLLKRIMFLALVGAGGYYGYTMWKRRQTSGTSAAEPVWPPLQVSTPPTHDPGVAEPHFVQISEDHTAHAPAAGQRWLAPVDGQCPDGYPIKANTQSGIFHVPGGRSYDRTTPERCYASAEAAMADGYRQAKS